MSPFSDGDSLEGQIDQWRAFLRRRQAIHDTDVEELEGHLRDRVEDLVGRGLSADEAFLVAVKRMGNLDAISREFAREHSERLWKQLVLAPSEGATAVGSGRTDLLVALALGLGAALAIKLPELFGYAIAGDSQAFYARNLSFFVLPFATAYFVWKRRVSTRTWLPLAAAFVIAAFVVNLYPFGENSDTQLLAAIHLPIALWLVVGIAYVGGRWFGDRGRMNFVRFSGELFIYYVLIALGGGVLTAFTMMMFEAIGVDAEWFAQEWLLPCGAMGAVLIGAWLVEAKQSVIENMAPVLTRLFTPLFTLVLLAFLVTMAVTGRGIDVEREVLIGFDLLLVVVLGLLLYAVSARDAESPPRTFDVLLLILVVSALIVDVVALAAIASRLSAFGFTPNRVAALGENLVLLVNLGWSAWLYARFLRGRGTFAAIERWQMDYLPVLAIWAALVVLVFPPLFGFA